ncbi:MAG: WG repeat-containing protein, partial [Bacteroidales bacterium]|nr:WG repeat-containing protein [Bacteroidales bacterium]
MMKRRPILSVCFAAFFCLVPSVGAQDYEDLPKLKEIKGKKLLEEITPVQDEKRGLWGYANSEGKFTIKPVFTAACPYEGNLARISVEGKWGLINNIGTYAVYPQFEAIEPFSADSLAVTRHEGKYGIIDNKGRCVAPFIYDSFTYTDYGDRFTRNGLTGTVG